jgi:hypothetical protein
MESVRGGFEQIKNKYAAAKEKSADRAADCIETDADVTARGGTCRP